MGPRQRQGRSRSKTHALPMILLSFLGFLLIAGVAFGIGMIGNVNRWLSDLPDYTDANAYLVSEPTDIVDTLDMDVYDLAEWCCMAELTRLSIENNSAPVEVPDFTRGGWNKVQGYRHAFAK